MRVRVPPLALYYYRKETMNNDEYKQQFDKRNDIQGLVLDTLNELSNQVHNYQDNDHNGMMVTSLAQYLASYIEVSNYLIEDLLKEVAMAEAHIADLERDLLRG